MLCIFLVVIKKYIWKSQVLLTARSVAALIWLTRFQSYLFRISTKRRINNHMRRISKDLDKIFQKK